MPLNAKGRKIKAQMIKSHGKEAGTREFYASENSGRIKDVTRRDMSTTARKYYKHPGR